VALLVGVDENGLGPLLGPLVTTSVSLELGRYQPARMAGIGRDLGIDDSKETAAFGRMAAAEGLALAVLEQTSGHLPRSVDEFLEALLLDAPAQLRGRCPETSRPQCWSVALALPCFGGDVAQGRQALQTLRKRGIHVRRAKSAVACTRLLNDRLALGQSRVELDLELMERLMLDARAALGLDLVAICGMVGGIRNYRERLRHIARERVVARRGRAGALVFEVEQLGQVRFEIDADQNHFPVALASMIGKYLRELWMLRHNRFYQAGDDSLADVSGYHDPVTRGFIQQSAALRRRLGVEDACFVRDSAKTQQNRLQLPLFAE
jgi:ribonuclease HII